MKINFSNLEVLSPAGSAECFFADINAGADAVYLGLSSFNARIKAENFTTENIREYVEYAHLFGVKVYITVNTLINNDEFPELIEMVKVLVDSKVDAFIIQDYGIAYALKNSFDNIVLHASTQMGIHNLYGAIMAERMGFTRIVLSRETKLEDIKLIRKNTNLEIEYFVQGALCVAFSGNCYLSSLEKGMSGNEGKCLQLCRLPYKNNFTDEVAYNLSARDLSLLENLPELIEAGVTSFKIEGRMRHAGYTAISTKIYKTALQKIKNGDFSKDWIEKQYETLRQTFSRGEFNKNAYLDNSTPDNIIYKDYQNHIGIEVGKVISVKPFKDNLFKVQVKSNVPLSSGDGIKIIDKTTKNQVASLGIGNITKINGDAENIFEFITKYKFSTRLSVFLTQNSKIEQEYLSSKRKIQIKMEIKAFSGQPLRVYAQSDTASIMFESDFIIEKAKNTSLSNQDFLIQFNKLSDTSFEINSINVQTDGVFIPKSLLNNSRREVVSLLKQQIIANNEQKTASFNEKNYAKICSKNIVSNPKNIAIIDDTFDFNKNLNNFDFIVLSPKIYEFNTISKFYEYFKERFVLNLPTISNFNDLNIINEILNRLPEKISLYSNNLYGLYFADKHKIIVSPLHNIKNKFSILFLNSVGIETICSSIEANEDFIKFYDLVSFNSGLFPLMTFAHCPIKTIYNNSCKSCKFSENLHISNNNLGSYSVKRTKIANCYFELNKPLAKKTLNFCIINFNK